MGKEPVKTEIQKTLEAKAEVFKGKFTDFKQAKIELGQARKEARQERDSIIEEKRRVQKEEFEKQAKVKPKK